MSDSYQAIYDAVRSRISNGDIGATLSEVARQSFDISTYVYRAACDFQTITYEMQRPAVLFRPSVYIDGNKWCALYGEDLQAGVAGFGDSPALAMEAFDKAWHERLPSNQRGEP